MKKVLTTPMKDEDIKDINVGDIVYLNGTLVTCRDVPHRRLVELGMKLPVDLKKKQSLLKNKDQRPNILLPITIFQEKKENRHRK